MKIISNFLNSTISKICFVLVVLLGGCSNNSKAQKKINQDLYFLFQQDTANYAIKSKARQTNPSTKEDVLTDLYHYSYLSKDLKYQYFIQLFFAVNPNNYCVVDELFFKHKKLLPYKKLEDVNGLMSDQWDEKTFFNKVYIAEKTAQNIFKIVEVKLYYPFSSNGVMVKRIEKDN